MRRPSFPAPPAPLMASLRRRLTRHGRQVRRDQRTGAWDLFGADGSYMRSIPDPDSLVAYVNAIPGSRKRLGP